MWGYRRIPVSSPSPALRSRHPLVWQILHAAGIDPAPRRTGPAWRQFLHAQAAGIVAVDFLQVDTVLLKRIHVLVFIEHGTRLMHIGGVTASPTGEWTVQQARNLALSLGERFGSIREPDPRSRIELHRLVRLPLPGHRKPGFCAPPSRRRA